MILRQVALHFAQLKPFTCHSGIYMPKGGLLKSIKEFLFGFAVHDHVVFAARTRAGLDDLLTVVTFGDMLGIPIFRPYHSLRLLPYLLPRLHGWKRRMLKERDLVDALD